MLLKFNHVEEIGRFASLKHKGEQFSRLTLVFARNGYGKSTICAILRSASEGAPNYIHARRRLDAKKETRVQSSWASGITVSFGGGKWNYCPGKVYVFDQEFVFQNLHVGDSVTRDNKRSLLPVVLGANGVQLSEKIIALDREQRELGTVLKKHGDVIRARCPVLSQSDLSAFCLREVPVDIVARREAAGRSVELAKQAAAVKQRKNPKTISFSDYDTLLEIAGRTITSVSEDAAQKVQRHLVDHNLGAHGERWLKYGVEHIADDQCPFCDQSLNGIEIIDAFRAYFSEAFACLINDRDQCIASIATMMGDAGIDFLDDENQADFAFWKQVCDLPTVPALSPNDRAIIKDGLTALDTALKQKVANPLSVVSLDPVEHRVRSAIDLIARYNTQIADCVVQIEAARAAVQTADLTVAQRVFQQWQAVEAKISEPVASAAIEYAKADARREAIEPEKKKAQDALTAYAKATMKTRQTEINELLSDFGVNFSIVDARASFVGRDPNTDYAIAIGNSKVGAGDKSETEPSFKTILSAGDKTTLALAFFLTQLRADPNLKDAVVVFDDPFSSQDMNRQFETTSQIRSIAGTACQTIVLSHDPRFLHMIEKDADTAVTKAFQLLCTDGGEGSISTWSTADELKVLYVRQSEIIRQFASHGTLLTNATEVGVLQSIRPFMEDYLRARFPGRFPAQQGISDMARAIESAGTDDPLFGSVQDLLAINEYTRTSMHGGGAIPDPTALRAQCKKVVRIVSQY